MAPDSDGTRQRGEPAAEKGKSTKAHGQREKPPNRPRLATQTKVWGMSGQSEFQNRTERSARCRSKAGVGGGVGLATRVLESAY